MTLLAELNVTKIGSWKDRAGQVVWKDTDAVETDVEWASSNILYLSLEGFVGDHYWDEYIATLTPPQYSMAKEHGGYCKMSFGSLSVSPGAFASTLWPPPTSFNLSFFYTATTEGAKETLFLGVAHLAEIGTEAITYDLYGTELDADLLLDATDYDGNTVVLPRGFGTVEYQKATRLADVAGAPTYHKAYIPGTSLAKAITAFSDATGGEVNAACASHGFSTNDNITIEGAFGSSGGAGYHYNGTHVITKVDANNYKFTATWVADAAAGHAYDNDNKADYILVYDDGVPIPGNVTDNGDGTFSLSANPVGEITIGGIGEDSTLSTIIDWACKPGRLNQNYDSSLAASPSPDINFWASSQRVLIEFVSNLCSIHLHLCYINTDTQTLYLVDLDTDNGTRTLTEFDFFSAQYQYEPPIAQITAKWTKRVAVNETIGKYVKNEDYETVQKSSYSYGEEWELEPFHNVSSEIDTALATIITNMHKPRIKVPLPLLGSLPVPGEKITLTDTKLRHNTTAVFRCRNVIYDFEQDEIFVEGEGTIT